MEFGLSLNRSFFDCVLAGVLIRARRGALYNGNCGSYLCKGSMSGAALSFSFGTGDLHISGRSAPVGEFSEGAISAAGRLPFGFGGTDEGVRPYTRCSCESAVCCL